MRETRNANEKTCRARKKKKERKKKERERARDSVTEDFGKGGGSEKYRESKILLRTACGSDECIAWRPREIMPAEYQRERALPINRFAKFMVPMTARGRDAVPVREIIPPSLSRHRDDGRREISEENLGIDLY